jgi:hypothetical protein
MGWLVASLKEAPNGTPIDIFENVANKGVCNMYVFSAKSPK